jgi:ubiquinone/menaquinone biosynthesis C-methylase UbiE
MSERGGPQTPIRPEAYTEEYFRTSVEGHEQFAASGGRSVSPRLRRALALADPKPGQRVLDIACGRGEVVLQSALRGADALGIDYAAAALAVARASLDGATLREPQDVAAGGRIALARMDATRLALAPASFDAALMLDFVEHVYQADLDAAFCEVYRVLKPAGRLIIHTSPNRVFEDGVYRGYVRNVHRVVLGTAHALRLEGGRFFNKIVLPTDELPPHDEYERTLHVNPQSVATLRSGLRRAGFRVQRIDFWEPPRATFFPPELRWHRLGLRALDAVRFLRPLSLLPPLNRLFSNHIWVVAERE